MGWKTDTVNTNKDTLKILAANINYEWQVASICQYPVVILSSYTTGNNFTTPVSFARNLVATTADRQTAPAKDDFSAAVYPNPASTDATVVVKGLKGSFAIRVETMEGVLLSNAEGLTGSSIKLPLSRLPAGIYMITVFDKEHKGRLQLVKQ